MVNNKTIDVKTIHCKFFEQFISQEWSKLRNTPEGLEIIRWRVLYWLAVWEKDIHDCINCFRLLSAIKKGLSNAGIKLDFEPEIHFK
ncbi:MAG: hypothetical protein MRECE_39c022 [Mycoplasmataceae bacterium CE_OT135]|nr:MAG: hypothetical protein MRECE_39c022 [Mycoplasmataceae bacterium CE_OT135]